MTKEEIKQTYSMTDILNRYGLRQNRAGFICCPFHKEKTASLKVYLDSFHCYGCGLNGDIFTFVQKMEGISFVDAFKELGGTFPEQEKNLTYIDRIRSARDRAIQADKKQKEKVADLSDKQKQLHVVAMWAGIYRKGMEVFEPFSDEWCFCANNLEPALYRLSVLLEEVWKEVKREVGQ